MRQLHVKCCKEQKEEEMVRRGGKTSALQPLVGAVPSHVIALIAF